MKRPRILLVDDEVAFADNLLKLLSKRGYDVVVVYNGADAVKTVGEKEFDVIILDMKMPGMDGIATLKEIRKIAPLVEVVILTGHGSVESGIEGMQQGAFDYLMKPVRIDDLQEKVSEAYQRKLIQIERE
ncbi:MAG: response regulator [Proteobacteria bacterium]|nr:response regulator [Pseudomonadota bacterium]